MLIPIDATTADVSRVDSVISAPVIAAIAAHAATSVPGVLRLEPGLAGLVTSLARTARQRIKNLDPAPTEGVRVAVADDARLHLDIDVVVSGQDQAAAVARTVQRAVAVAIVEATGLVTSAVSVSIMDIEPSGAGR